MAIVNVNIHSVMYQVACDDGQEEYLRSLAARLDHKVSNTARTLGKSSEQMLLVMTALMIEDEMEEMKRSSSVDSKCPVGSDLVVADIIEKIAIRIETIANNLTK